MAAVPFVGNDTPESLMLSRLPFAGWAPRAGLFAALLPLLAGCGPGRNQFAPICPGTAILGEAADYSAYRGSTSGGAPRDLADLVLQGHIVSMHGSCQPGEDKSHLAVAITVDVDLTRGPAMAGRDAQVPLFVAVVEGRTILDKNTYQMHVTFPSNVDHTVVSPGAASFSLPVSPTKTGAEYTLIAGFQLTGSALQSAP
jgi:hypothetical protein